MSLCSIEHEQGLAMPNVKRHGLPKPSFPTSPAQRTQNWVRGPQKQY